MKSISLRLIVCFAIVLPLYTYADGCEYDTQCKGDRICENKKCVSPQAAAQTSTPVAPAATPAQQSSGFLGIFAKSPAPATDAKYFCCTMSEKLGPYPNPGSDGKVLHVGDACSGTTKTARLLTGRVCD